MPSSGPERDPSSVTDVGPGEGGPEIRRAALLMGVALAVLPLLAVTYPPVADLPQHLAQIRLLEELLGLAPRTTDLHAMHILWTSPSVLVYFPLLVSVRLFGPILGGRVLIALLLAAEVATIHAIAARRNRPVAGALIAGLFVFNQSLYWGFLNMMSAVPLFLWLVDRASVAPRPDATRRDAALVLLLGVATYLAHSILFACGALAVVAFGLARRDPMRLLAPRVLALAPPLVAASVWFPGLAARRRAAGFDLDAVWASTLVERLSFSSLVDATFGGLGGIIEPVAFVAVVLYVLLSLATHARDRLRGVDGPLASFALALLLAYLIAPDKWMNTLLFAQRFASLGAVALVLAMPAPKLPQRIVTGYALVLPLLFALATTTAWSLFETTELSGLTASLRAARHPQRVVGLDFRGTVPELKTRPFLQLFAYVQAEHGGDVNFSFAEHASSIVAYRAPRRFPWTVGLEWYPFRFGPRDMRWFDYALVVASDPMHARFASATGARPLVRDGQVRLYRIPRQRRSAAPAPAP